MIHCLLTLLLLFLSSCQNILTHIDTISYLEHTFAYQSSNTLGLSINILELIPNVENTLLQEYLVNTQVYGSWSSSFGLTLHNPVGCKYNCSIA